MVYVYQFLLAMLGGAIGAYWRNLGERIDSNSFPSVTFENSPMEVELVIKK